MRLAKTAEKIDVTFWVGSADTRHIVLMAIPICLRWGGGGSECGFSQITLHNHLFLNCYKLQSCLDEKLSNRWQTARRLCTPMLRSWHKTPRSTAFHAVLSTAELWWLAAIYWSNFPTLTISFPTWRFHSGASRRAIWFIFGMRKLEWLDYNLLKVAVVLAQLYRYTNTAPMILKNTYQTQRAATHGCRQAKRKYFPTATTCT